jgi:anti-anti-sigma regulatory factor
LIDILIEEACSPMQRPYRFITLERDGDVLCVRLQNPRIDDQHMEELGAELARLIDDEKSRQLVICLGPDEPDCLISVFLAKLISLQRRLDDVGGSLALAHVSDHTRDIFRAAGIEKLFDFYADQPAAVQALQAPG